MDDEFKWLVGVIALVFGGLFGALAYEAHLGHIEKMECIKQRGESIKGVCVFREQKPAQ